MSSEKTDTEIEKGSIGSSFDDFLEQEGILKEVTEKTVANSMIQSMKEAVEYAEEQNNPKSEA